MACHSPASQHIGHPRSVHAVYAPTRHVPLKLRVLIDYLAEVEGSCA